MSPLTLEALRSPPRRVSLGARLQVALFGTIQLIGWGFLAMGLLTGGLMLRAIDLRTLTLDDEEARRRPGEIVSVEATSVSVNEESVMAVRALYQDGAGEEREVVSYLTGWAPTVGEEVLVLDFPGAPDAAVIEGARRSHLGPWALFVLIFPVVGAVFVFWRLRVQRRWAALLERGEATRAVLKARERTGSRVNEQPVIKFTFEYFDLQGDSHTFSVKTHRVADLGDEPNEAVLYDPERPSLGVPLDLIAGGLSRDPAGTIVASKVGTVIGLSLRPIIVLLVGLAVVLF